ncbi:hypothetical protein D6T64_19500 [Cryobacterium melibiosiphilum]|uniref:Rhodanese domain-containing protein n=1 Tax=Cryobacterium melibiosiphilum TaxID=995039 RepID=A0A3A5MJU9_9MICO|nr:rhodanese-like domain-containing protein [Cryobacterium melibiosiphilum]RJT85129.1 hypothetical protein D6T64_19500 [Cryobacterium melibiosiphilum]
MSILVRDLGAWTGRRWLLAAGTAAAAFIGMVAAGGLVVTADAALGNPSVAAWWALPAVVVVSALVAMVVASYVNTPIGADATMCDTRWPLFGLVGIYLATELRSLEPVLSTPVRPVVALAAVTLLVWALRSRLAKEHRATAARVADSDAQPGGGLHHLPAAVRPRGAARRIRSHPTRKPPMKKTLATLVLALTAVFGLAACAPTADPIEVTANTVVIDVRTAAEYDAGHLEGAVNIDVESADFDALVGALPTDGEYVVYCASGNRSSGAVLRMADLGFTAVTDAGGISAAESATGLAVVAAP